MKIAIVCLAACIALAVSETCKDHNDCDYEHCSGDWKIACDKGRLTGIPLLGDRTSGTCTCSKSGSPGTACNSQSTCSTPLCPGTGTWTAHCIDAECKCTFGSNGK